MMRWIDLEPREVDGRHPVLPGEQLGQLVFIEEAKLHQAVAEPHAALRLLLEGARELLLGDEPLAEEQLADSVLGRYRSCHVRRFARRVSVVTR